MIANLSDFLLTESVDSSEESKIRKKLHWVKIVDDKVESAKDSSFIDLSDYSNPSSLDGYIETMINQKKTGQNTFVFPVDDWALKTKSSVYNLDAKNPIAAIHKWLKFSPNRFKSEFKGCRFIFCNDYGYFDFVADNVTNTSYKDFVKAIDSMYNSRSIKSKNAIGNVNSIKKSASEIKNTNPVKSVEKSLDKEEKRKETQNKLATAIGDITSDCESEDEALAKIENDENIKRILAELEEVDGVNINAARSTRMKKLNTNFMASTVKGDKVSDILEKKKEDELPSTELKIDSINEEWKDMKFMNFQNAYNINDDIIRIIDNLSKLSYPIGIIKVDVEDTSTVMDYVDTYTVNCEDSFGKRFTLKFDIPQFVNNRFMRLRGNDKTISGQLPLIPCIKTDDDTTQIVTNYNKVFIRRYGTKGRSLPTTDRLLKTLRKLVDKKTKINGLTIVPGDNAKICNKYDLPIDYIDIASEFTRIKITNLSNGLEFIFDQDYFRSNYNVDKDKLPIAIDGNSILYFENFINSEDAKYESISDIVVSYLIYNEEFRDIYESTKPANKMIYSKASILSTEIPVIVILGYLKGLNYVLKQANIKNKFNSDRKPEDDSWDTIKFSDGYLHYKITYESSLLMNGLKECDTDNYSFSEVDSKRMWLDFLDNYGGRILADGLENFYDLLMDPITVDTCGKFGIPTTFEDIMIYASNLLTDNKYNRHVDISGNRFRTNEIVAGYTYKCLARSYAEYRTNNKKGRRVPMQIKRSAIIDAIMQDPVASDLSTMSALSESEAANTVSFKGLSGMNSDRAYGLDKRTYDDSMINKLALSTGFAANVGISRQATIDMDIEGSRGYIKNDGPEDMSVTKTFSMAEALTPFGTTRDDPFRSAMTFIQTSKHSMRTKASGPLLITNGSDEALPYMCSDVFSFKAKNDGTVIEIVENQYMILEYKDGSHDYIDLSEQVKKNSDGGFFVTLKLIPDVKLKGKFKKGDIVAHDPLSFSRIGGATDNLSYSIGTLAKVALPITDAGYEDSTEIDEWLSEAMSSDIVAEKEITFAPNTNIYNMVSEGQYVQEGDPLILFQNSFDEKDANLLLKAITDEDMVSDLGRIRIKSKYTGVVEKIKIYRTAPIETYSTSIQGIIKKYEKNIKATKSVYKKYNIPGVNKIEPDYELPPTGRLKDVGDGIKIIFYIKYVDKLSVGDKIVGQSAAKGVIKDVFPKGKEPYSSFRPDEKIHAMFSVASYNARMITSVLVSGALNKGMIELDRAVKEIMGIKAKSIDEIQMPEK